MNKQNVLKITHSNSASGDLMKLVQGSRCTLLKLTRQCMVPVHGLNSLKSCSQTSEYFHKILETLQMPNMKVKLLQRLTFSSSRFAERWFNWQNLHNQPPAFIISSTLILNVISKNSSKQHVSQCFIGQSKSNDGFLKLWITLGYWLVEYRTI